MDDLLELYKLYADEEYSIEDVSRIISYIAIPQLDEEYIRQIENQIEWIRFMCDKNEQKGKVISLLNEMIEKVKST